ncbi:ARID/BRIGHT DNA binding domain-containing protein [Ditylenchus destructor]|uniref:ARID/BRIGHT DNA binding domain-containing protein n=1 Tax=Ditylenchus destructor TaxID=166010 RepID=A0AAD4R6Y6_9BILA|nr:ARID/BRIGHT DNA binding domain-containing protein [Ditylenchus destructor]
MQRSSAAARHNDDGWVWGCGYMDLCTASKAKRAIGDCTGIPLPTPSELSLSPAGGSLLSFFPQLASVHSALADSLAMNPTLFEMALKVCAFFAKLPCRTSSLSTANTLIHNYNYWCIIYFGPVADITMNRRKLLTALDEYLKGITESTEYSSKKVQFYSNLRHFYRKKWGCPLKVPFLQGMEVDMFKLYETVLSLGGWQKVTSMERWPQVLDALEIDEDIQMAEYHIKSLYMRFLAKFEQSETGNDPDEHDSDLMGSRGRSINRAHFGMASSEAPVAVHRTVPVSEYPDYPKLIKSLLSGIPNEVDFAINVCCLLSHPGPYLLRLSECPNLITALAAHCGVFNDGPGSLKDLHTEAWQEQSQHDFLQFWQKSGITDDDILSFMPEFDRSIASSKAQNASQLDVDETFDPNFGDDRLELKKTVNWRVFQILSIFRNVSFEDTNKAPLAGNLPLIKLLIICCNCRWQQLVNTAFDILSNIASDIDLTMDGSVFSDHLLLKTVSMGMFSDDKFQILRSLEILSGLCNIKCNEQLICEFVEERILGRIFTLVTTKDILMCLTTLESLYQMSELGRPSCEVLSSYNRGVDILVDLATTDAASFGASGLAGIKVVEIHGPTGQLHPYQPQRSHPLAAIPPLFPQQSRPLSPFSPPSSPSMVSGRHHQFAPAQPSPLTVHHRQFLEHQVTK